jgi:hypothetical protein
MRVRTCREGATTGPVVECGGQDTLFLLYKQHSVHLGLAKKTQSS